MVFCSNQRLLHDAFQVNSWSFRRALHRRKPLLLRSFATWNGRNNLLGTKIRRKNTHTQIWPADQLISACWQIIKLSGAECSLPRPWWFVLSLTWQSFFDLSPQAKRIWTNQHPWLKHVNQRALVTRDCSAVCVGFAWDASTSKFELHSPSQKREGIVKRSSEHEEYSFDSTPVSRSFKRDKLRSCERNDSSSGKKPWQAVVHPRVQSLWLRRWKNINIKKSLEPVTVGVLSERTWPRRRRQSLTGQGKKACYAELPHLRWPDMARLDGFGWEATFQSFLYLKGYQKELIFTDPRPFFCLVAFLQISRSSAGLLQFQRLSAWPLECVIASSLNGASQWLKHVKTIAFLSFFPKVFQKVTLFNIV